MGLRVLFFIVRLGIIYISFVEGFGIVFSYINLIVDVIIEVKIFRYLIKEGQNDLDKIYQGLEGYLQKFDVFLVGFIFCRFIVYFNIVVLEIKICYIKVGYR